MPNQVEFIKGKGGLPFLKVNNTKASALISIYAGQVLSYKPEGEAEDVMFVSENAYFQEGKAIKGGVPICWPWFGADITDPEHPDHGFARNSNWTVSSVDMLAGGNTRIKLELVDSESTHKIWPYKFYLSLEVIVGDKLSLELSTCNKGDQPFTITEALHTYFNVGDATQVEVLGLEHAEYLNKAENYVEVCQVAAIALTSETDRIYTDVKHDLTLVDPVFNRNIKISSSGNKNVVVWNPWIERSAEISDLDRDDYKHFVCIEIANAASSTVEISPGEEYKMLTKYSVIKK